MAKRQAYTLAPFLGDHVEEIDRQVAEGIAAEGRGELHDGGAAVRGSVNAVRLTA
jgi:hypothetical protein